MYGQLAIKYKNVTANKPVKNILILGETGVGKSTWINGIANYFAFDSLDDACKGDIQVHIPTSFYQLSQKMKIGKESKNENLNQVGQSATQKPRIYTLTKDGRDYINLIDTPGIGDVRGTDKDKENFDEILAHISCMKSLDAICILLKSMDCRLTLTFRYCIQELLIRLHTSVKSNILFCFTHSRSALYGPGDAFPVLNEELAKKNIGMEAIHDDINRNDKKNNCFCFDNEAFRYLVCVKNGKNFSPEIHKTFAESWNQSKKETTALFKKIDDLVPHNVADTISVNQARNIIIALSKPMGECLSVITDNLKIAQDINNQIKGIVFDLVNFEKTLKFKGFSLSTKALDYPMTVCAHKDCIEYVPVGKSQISETHYKTICHNHCYLKDVPTQVINNRRLASCDAFKNGPKCIVCSHTYDVHMHITYATSKIEEEFISQDVQKLILDKKSKREQIEELEKQILYKVKELQEEKEIISSAAVKFSAYVVKNALIAYNDVFGEYIKMMIREEKDKFNLEDSKIERLKEILQSYEEQKKSILDAIANGSFEKKISSEDISNLKNQLINLKHMGKTLNNVLTSVMSCLEKTHHPRRPRVIGKLATIPKSY